ncbi:MAG: hypothetical protein AAF639_14700 [Chloroflexota bacterium]
MSTISESILSTKPLLTGREEVPIDRFSLRNELLALIDNLPTSTIMMVKQMLTSLRPNSQSVINQENISHAILDTTTEANVPYQYPTVGVPITNLDFLDDDVFEGHEGDSLEDSEETFA